jgi:hypothetical protein
MELMAEELGENTYWFIYAGLAKLAQYLPEDERACTLTDWVVSASYAMPGGAKYYEMEFSYRDDDGKTNFGKTANLETFVDRMLETCKLNSD